jgi:hypothetical protein
VPRTLLPGHDQVGVAADRRGEVGIGAEREPEMAVILRAVIGLRLRAQHLLHDLGPEIRLAHPLDDPVEGRGPDHLAEGELDLDMTQEDRDMLIDYLVSEGLLSASDLTYGPNTQRGYEEIPGGGDRPGVPSEPIPLDQLLPFAATAWGSSGGFLNSVSSIFQQDTMLQPVGGLSEIFDTGFREALGEVVHGPDVDHVLRRGEALVTHPGERPVGLEPDHSGLGSGLVYDFDRLTHGGRIIPRTLSRP